MLHSSCEAGHGSGGEFSEDGADADMRKGADTRTLSAEILMDCGNFRYDLLYFPLIYSKKYI